MLRSFVRARPVSFLIVDDRDVSLELLLSCSRRRDILSLKDEIAPTQIVTEATGGNGPHLVSLSLLSTIASIPGMHPGKVPGSVYDQGLRGKPVESDSTFRDL